MAKKYECLKCGFVGKPLVLEPAQMVCPKCGSVQLKKVDEE